MLARVDSLQRRLVRLHAMAVSDLVIMAFNALSRTGGHAYWSPVSVRRRLDVLETQVAAMMRQTFAVLIQDGRHAALEILDDATKHWRKTEAWSDEARAAALAERRAHKKPKDKSRSERAKATYKPATVEKQRRGELEQLKLAKVVGLENTSDNLAFDMLGRNIAVEVKTVMDNSHDKITMHPESRRRKEEYAKMHHLKACTVAIDIRGGRRIYYYKSGVGAFRLGGMERIDLGTLKARLVA
jgi:hypothetical protein